MALPLTHIAVTNSSASTLYSALQTISLYILGNTKNTNTNTKLQNTFSTLLSPIPRTAASTLLQPICVFIHNHKFWKKYEFSNRKYLKSGNHIADLNGSFIMKLCTCLSSQCNVEELEKRMAGPQRSVANLPICLWILQRSAK